MTMPLVVHNLAIINVHDVASDFIFVKVALVAFADRIDRAATKFDSKESASHGDRTMSSDHRVLGPAASVHSEDTSNSTVADTDDNTTAASSNHGASRSRAMDKEAAVSGAVTRAVARLGAYLRLHDDNWCRHVLATRGSITCTRINNPKVRLCKLTTLIACALRSTSLLFYLRCFSFQFFPRSLLSQHLLISTRALYENTPTPPPLRRARVKASGPKTAPFPCGKPKPGLVLASGTAKKPQIYANNGPRNGLRMSRSSTVSRVKPTLF